MFQPEEPLIPLNQQKRDEPKKPFKPKQKAIFIYGKSKKAIKS